MNKFIDVKSSLLEYCDWGFQFFLQRLKSLLSNKGFYFLVLMIPFMLKASTPNYAQKITLHEKNAPLEGVLEKIHALTGFHFLYTKDILKKANLVTIDVENRELLDALNILFDNQPIGYDVKGNNFLIKEKPSSMAKKEKVISQPIKVKGTVKSSTGEPLAGASVSVVGTSVATSTNVDGVFELSLSPGDVLSVKFIGYAAREVTYSGGAALDIVLEEDSQSLQEVVVSALGIERQAKSVTYAAQTVSAEDITRTKEPNMMNSLAGKAAGVVITRGTGGPGASSKVLLRGNKSITGNNQPLYVIDGIPMNSANGPQGGGLFGTLDRGDAVSNLNPDDIESMEILKGASAAALYGSQAANGVIMITTKKGKAGTSEVSFTSSSTFDTPLALPEIQTSYGQGSLGVANTNINDSWGPAITNGSDSHLSNFFNTGSNYLNSVSISSGNSLAQVYASYANTSANGIVPENKYSRHNLNLRGTAKILNEKVTLDGGINYIKQSVYNRPQAGFYYSPMFSLYLFPPGDDMSKYSGDKFETWDETRLMNVQNWPYILNQASSNQNPYWITKRNQTDDIRNRNIYNFSARWDALDWLYVQARFTYDRVEDNYELRQYASSDPTLVGSNGGYQKRLTNTDQMYTDVMASGRGALSDAFNLQATIGFSNMYNRYYDVNLANNGAANLLAYPNYFSIYSLSNTGGNFLSTESLQRRETQAVFATATLGFKDYLYLDVTGRNEWASTVNQSFFYPSVGLSYVITDHLAASDALSFAKLRVSYAEVGNQLPFGVAVQNPPYTLAPDDNINGRETVPYFEGTNYYDLNPERTTSYEVGTDLRFFSDKLSVGVTYYDATTKDQVFSISAPAGAGASNFWINGGKIRNYGFEATASYSAKLGNVDWTPAVNFSKNVNQIRELSELLSNEFFTLNSGGSTRMIQLLLARPGISNLRGREYGAYGDLFGNVYVRDESGNLVIGDNGLPTITSNADQYLGNANPDFLLSFNNQFRYKNFNFSFMIDGRFGGEIVSQTEQWLDWKGISKRSGEARDAGGVMVGGNLIDAQTYYNFTSGAGDVAAAAEEYIFDATNVRLRELSLGYTFPSFWRGLKSLNLSLVGRNLFFLYKDAPFDPEVSISTANSMQGMDAFNMPPTRSFGFTLSGRF
ncbi:SusC/RagA family TonB-linked outer membrane protein [Olivibacter sitiensis]|uniref:SusC/RagA family TonB-linked outer membrane protein n=1 Tax=Olivibacter sitiensis TaxID=376470 RepID=UPI00041A9A9B|nr:SusC/RagA family TonB-linked outer membrane protein [Olivibacter sitiensis]